MSKHLNRETRKWIYGVLLALFPILAAAGVALPGGQEAWLVLAAAVLGMGQSSLAMANLTPEKGGPGDPGPYREYDDSYIQDYRENDDADPEV